MKILCEFHMQMAAQVRFYMTAYTRMHTYIYTYLHTSVLYAIQAYICMCMRLAFVLIDNQWSLFVYLMPCYWQII